MPFGEEQVAKLSLDHLSLFEFLFGTWRQALSVELNCSTHVSVVRQKVTQENGAGEKVVKTDVSVFVRKWMSHANDNIVAKAIHMAFVSLAPKVNREVCKVSICKVCSHPHFDAIFCRLRRHVLLKDNWPLNAIIPSSTERCFEDS